MQEMKRRRISEILLEGVLLKPEQIVGSYSGCRVYQSRLPFSNGKVYLIRIIVDERKIPFKIITVYKTSKIKKYWEFK